MSESSGREYWRSPIEDLTQQEGSAQDDTQELGMQADPTVGTPGQDTGTWDGQQSYDDTCAIRCQEFILEQYTGLEVDETGLVQTAAENGWYTPGAGTDPENVGKLLEMYGVETNTYENANTFNLANELAQGHKVIISVDSGELWNEEDPVLKDVASNADVDGADHAVVVSGIDASDPANPEVIVSDPGTGEAKAHYPMDKFLAAWQDSDFTMTATQDPAPSTLPEMSNFDYEAGHVPTALGMPYDQLVQYEQIANDEQHPAHEALDRWVDWFGAGEDPAAEVAYASMPPEVAGLHREVDSFVNDTRSWMQDHNAEIAAGGEPGSGRWSEDYVQAVNNRLIRTMELQDQAMDPQTGAEAYSKLGQWYAGMQSYQQPGETDIGTTSSYDTSSHYSAPMEQTWDSYYQEYGDYYQGWGDYEVEMAEYDAYWGDYEGAEYHAESAEAFYNYAEDYDTGYIPDDTSYTDTSSDYSSTDYSDSSDY